jgi:hypothetical protein
MFQPFFTLKSIFSKQNFLEFLESKNSEMQNYSWTQIKTRFELWEPYFILILKSEIYDDFFGWIGAHFMFSFSLKNSSRFPQETHDDHPSFESSTFVNVNFPKTLLITQITIKIKSHKWCKYFIRKFYNFIRWKIRTKKDF